MARKQKSRRANGDGSIITRRDRNGRPQIYARLLTGRVLPSGEPQRIERRAETRTEAAAILRQLQQEYGVTDDRAAPLLSAAIQQYKHQRLTPPVYAGEHRASGLKSWHGTRQRLDRIAVLLPDIAVDAITFTDLVTARETRLAQKTRSGKPRPVSLATVNRDFAALRGFFSWCVQQGWIVRSPFQAGRGLIQNAAEQHRTRIATPEEEAAILAQCVGRRAHLRPIVICARETAMRLGEILGLRWSQVDLAAGVINLTARNTKTGRRRLIPITRRLREELERLQVAKPPSPASLVFGELTTIKTAWNSACRAAGVTGLHFHDLRHTATTRMVRAGIPESQVQEITGHTQYSTFRRYSNLNEQIAREIAARLDAGEADK